MAPETVRVGVLIEKRLSASPWAEFSWHVLGVVIEPPVQANWVEVRNDDQAITYIGSGAEVEAYTGETSGYRDNLISGEPKLWVVLRPTEQEPGQELALVTADPAEGEAMTENGDLLVEAVPMPEAIRLWLAAFVDKHHVERPFFKRKRE